MKKNEKIDFEDVCRIADVLTEIDNPDEDYNTTEMALVDKWQIDMDTFYEIVNGIFKMIDMNVSPLTSTPYVGISKGNMWLAKKNIEQQFIHSVITWITEGEDIPKEKGKGFSRLIHSKKNKLDISIVRVNEEI